MATRVRSHCKINLGLAVGPARADGYHGLTTIYQTLSLYDVVTVSARAAGKTEIRLSADHAGVPSSAGGDAERNTAWKMVAAALERMGVTAEVAVDIRKRLPVQGGLGAGSANAVAALVGLEAELGIASSVEDSRPGRKNTNVAREGHPAIQRVSEPADWSARRLEIAAKVGSDVPLFLIGGAVLGRDRGQQVDPLPDFEPVWCVVAMPEVGVSTPQAFRDWDSLCLAEGLTAEASTDKLKELSHAYASAFAEAIPEGRQGAGSSGVPSNEGDLAGPMESALVRTGITSWIENDFERVVFPQHPSLAEIKRILAASDTPEAALHASLSGSGSALFGLYRTRGDAEVAQERLRPAGVRSTLTRTLPRSKYWREMLLP